MGSQQLIFVKLTKHVYLRSTPELIDFPSNIFYPHNIVKFSPNKSFSPKPGSYP